MAPKTAKAARSGRCDRCSDTLRGSRFLNSMAMLKDGRVDRHICTDCLSLEEMAELIIRESTTDIGITRDGRYMTRPKVQLAS
jgi:hypothetical protein